MFSNLSPPPTQKGVCVQETVCGVCVCYLAMSEVGSLSVGFTTQLPLSCPPPSTNGLVLLIFKRNSNT